MKSIATLLSTLVLPLCAAAGGGGPTILAPPSINLQPRPPVLDQKCVDRVKGSGGDAARAMHECRKPYSPDAARGSSQTPVQAATH
ncbi:MAG: hypothetical protein P4L83_00935 [Nevskia sp.]|nr:hypothetical protein [Nevskia sp.]